MNKEHNCIECFKNSKYNGTKDKSHCGGKDYLDSSNIKGVCGWYLTAGSDLIKYDNNNPNLTLGNMLMLYKKKQGENNDF